MKYFKAFANHSEYESYITGSSVAYPNVSVCEDEYEVHITDVGEIVDPDKYKKQYLTFTALENGTFKFSGITTAHTLSYSLDSGETWVALAHNTDTPTINSGDSIMWKGECTPVSASSSSYGIGKFISSGRFNVQGNTMSLLYGDNYQNQVDLTGKDNAFAYLFSGNTNVISAENMELPATTLSENCYRSMFRGCSNITIVPQKLPATTLTNTCYTSMFLSCSSLTGVPSDLLPATNLAQECYWTMFAYCTNLTTVPELPATTLSENCYQSMFKGCSNITIVPQKLPATTLAQGCYNGMFWNCTGITTVPELPATALAERCYFGTFNGCTSLTGVSSDYLPATTLASGCYMNMFSGCTALTAAPELPAATLVEECYCRMFSGCTSLNYVKCLATDISATNCTTNWISGVASSGTFVKPSTTDWSSKTGNDGIPTNWTVEDAS